LEDVTFEPEEIWSLVSTKAKNFVSALLVIDPKSHSMVSLQQDHQHQSAVSI
jgi:hypothetical protein